MPLTSDKVGGSTLKDNAAIQYSPIPQVEGTTMSGHENDSTREIRPMFQEVHDNYDNRTTSAINRRRFDQSTESPTQKVQNKLRAVVDSLKQPRNLIVSVAFVLAILTLAAIVSSPHLIGVFCEDGKGTYAIYSYPYKMSRTSLAVCTDACFLTRGDRCSSSAHFFAFVCVISFMMAFAFIVSELVFANSRKRIELLNKVELAVDAILVIAWFAGSIAWAAAVVEIRQISAKAYIAGLLQAQTQFTDCVIHAPTNSSLIISVILGFCNCAVWILSLLYSFKSNNIFKKRQSVQEISKTSSSSHVPNASEIK
ncbi:hypothetical protein GJ496_002420 [Pomphorhynchus laevis]|nr:hypothetical protein GJ496_002420 [Pomphorhynchus laevis]